MKQAPLIGISRHRLGTDGHGITTLVAFHGCALRCKYCINHQCMKPSGIRMVLTPEQLYDKLKKDALYYIATSGGITFGGGEPMYRSDFIKEVLELGAKKWQVNVESSLNVPLCNIEELLPYVDHYYIDIKDMNPDIYYSYTQSDNRQVVDNLRFLVENGKTDAITCRIPLIPEYNTASDQNASIDYLKSMGVTRFDKFQYKTIIRI